MLKSLRILRFIGTLWLLMLPVAVLAEEYQCEIGLQLGGGYCVGNDLGNEHVFKDAILNAAEAYGCQFRYKFDQRWAIQAKVQRQRISFEYAETSYYNPALHIDVVAEFNFFRFGISTYDRRVKRFTPFVFIGVGASAFTKDPSYRGHENYPFLNGQQPLLMQAKEMDFGCYIPLGFGLKWKFHERWQLQAAWQHQVYIVRGDGLEGIAELNNPNELNGANILNNDYVSTLTIGIVYEFGRKKRVCHFCE